LRPIILGYINYYIFYIFNVKFDNNVSAIVLKYFGLEVLKLNLFTIKYFSSFSIYNS
jgi:hypothetical protein